MPEDTEDDALTPQDDQEDQDEHAQAPALVINCAPLLTRIVEVVGRDGVVYRLRDDVPTDRLLWAFNLLDITPRITQAASWEEREQALDDYARERLNVATTIVRHSYPAMTRSAVNATFTEAQMGELLGYFFTSRLFPFLEQRRALAQQAAQEAQDAPQAGQPAPKVSQRTATAGVTRSPRR